MKREIFGKQNGDNLRDCDVAKSKWLDLSGRYETAAELGERCQGFNFRFSQEQLGFCYLSESSVFEVGDAGARQATVACRGALPQ